MRDEQGTVSSRKVRHQPHREAAGAALDSGRPGHCSPGDGFLRDATSRGLAATARGWIGRPIRRFCVSASRSHRVKAPWRFCRSSDRSRIIALFQYVGC